MVMNDDLITEGNFDIVSTSKWTLMLILVRRDPTLCQQLQWNSSSLSPSAAPVPQVCSKGSLNPQADFRGMQGCVEEG